MILSSHYLCLALSLSLSFVESFSLQYDFLICFCVCVWCGRTNEEDSSKAYPATAIIFAARLRLASVQDLTGYVPEDSRSALLVVVMQCTLYMDTHIYIYTHIRVCVYTYTHTIYACGWVCMYVCMYVCR